MVQEKNPEEYRNHTESDMGQKASVDQKVHKMCKREHGGHTEIRQAKGKETD